MEQVKAQPKPKSDTVVEKPTIGARCAWEGDQIRSRTHFEQSTRGNVFTMWYNFQSLSVLVRPKSSCRCCVVSGWKLYHARHLQLLGADWIHLSFQGATHSRSFIMTPRDCRIRPMSNKEASVRRMVSMSIACTWASWEVHLGIHTRIVALLMRRVLHWLVTETEGRNEFPHKSDVGCCCCFCCCCRYHFCILSYKNSHPTMYVPDCLSQITGDVIRAWYNILQLATKRILAVSRLR